MLDTNKLPEQYSKATFCMSNYVLGKATYEDLINELGFAWALGLDKPCDTYYLRLMYNLFNKAYTVATYKKPRTKKELRSLKAVMVANLTMIDLMLETKET